MPFNFPPAPTAYFSRMKESQSEPKKRGAVPVEPLTLGYNPTRTQPMIPQKPPHRQPPMAHMLQQMNIPMPPIIPPQKIPQTPPMIPQPQASEQNPASAAEQFQRVNKNLPDGVRYEPLDDETLKILREKKPSAPSIEPEKTPDETIEILKNLAQYEHNNFIFYKNSENETFAPLEKISQEIFEIYASLLPPDFAPQQPEEIPDVSKGLTELEKLLEAVENTPHEKTIQRALRKKIISRLLA
jgi:hypothetical protein